jgi:uncharacterized protein
MIYLADVNFWIALAAEQHVHHGIARNWFISARAEGVAFCRITQLGFLRLLTNRHVMKEEALTPIAAWDAYGLLRRDRGVGYLREPAAFSEQWRDFTPAQAGSPNLWTDAYLSALAQAAQMTLVTFDEKIPATTRGRCLVLR